MTDAFRQSQQETAKRIRQFIKSLDQQRDEILQTLAHIGDHDGG
jgi:hypothetical protein